MSPRDEDELLPMLEHAVALDGAGAIRYPGAPLRAPSADRRSDEQGKSEVLRQGARVAILAMGNTVEAALDAHDLLAREPDRSLRRWSTHDS